MKVPEKHRIVVGPMASDFTFGCNGAFKIPLKPLSHAFVIASDGKGWEHVSVHVVDNNRMRTPTWDEMCKIKGMFWDKNEVVIQYHPRESEYVNLHKNCLHLWKPIGVEIPTPPKELIGF